jgi:serine/threonine protein kinase
MLIDSCTGGGNFGDVYYGEWDGTPVALKQLKNDEDYVNFVSEAATLSQLIHPNIVQVWKCFWFQWVLMSWKFLGVYESKDGKKYIVTEYLKKGTVGW